MIPERMNGRFTVGDGCWGWIGTLDKDGYGRFASKRATRTIMSAPSGLVVMHACDNPSCVRPSHLRVATQSENIRDAVQKGRWNPPRGSSAWNAKLSEDDIPVIHFLLDRGYYQRDVASAYRVNQSQISRIRNGSRWASATGQKEPAGSAMS